jgi:hypothetical protein
VSARAHHPVCCIVDGGAAIHVTVLASEDDVGARTIAKAIVDEASRQGRSLCDLSVRWARAYGVATVEAMAREAQS